MAESGSPNIDALLFPPEEGDKEDFSMTRTEFEQISEAFRKDEGFRKLFVDYVEEIQDPENQATYQREMRQLELERGNHIHFINPRPGYVLKTSVNGEKKGFINICSNPLIKKADFKAATQNKEAGNMWSIPFAQSPPREDVDKSKSFCMVYDVIFNPETIAMSQKAMPFREKLEQTAIESVEKSFNVVLDKNNIKRPKITYKGLARATVVKYKIGDDLPSVIDPKVVAAKHELPPQCMPEYRKSSNKTSDSGCQNESMDASRSKSSLKITSPSSAKSPQADHPRNRSRSRAKEVDDEELWTEPKYAMKFRSHVDMQDYSMDNRKIEKTAPDELILIIDLPLLRDSSTLEADVVDGGYFFVLRSDHRARYKLKLKLPYQVQGDTAKATFDKDKRKLTVAMKTVKKKPTLIGKPPSQNVKDMFVVENRNEEEDDKEVTREKLYGSGDAPSLFNPKKMAKEPPMIEEIPGPEECDPPTTSAVD